MDNYEAYITFKGVLSQCLYEPFEFCLMFVLHTFTLMKIKTF